MGEFKFAKYIGLAALGLSSTAWAGGPPVAYDNWAVSTGTITPGTCAADSCGTAMTDSGFFQREIVKGGVKYIQTIITDPTATAATAATIAGLPFANEDFVRFGNSGYAGKMALNTSETSGSGASAVTDKMAYSSTFNTGWAMDASNNFMTVNQTVSSLNSTSTTVFSSAANIIQKDADQANQDVTLDQMALMTPDSGKQKFQYHSISGTLQTTAHTAATDPAILAGGTSGGNISWAAGDKVSSTWLGQTLTTAGSTFGYTRFAAPTGDTYLTSFSDANPAGTPWIAPFGTAPTF